MLGPIAQLVRADGS